MKLLCLLFLAVVPGFSQLFSAGVRAGVPFTDFLNATSASTPTGFVDYVSTTNRYIFGPTAELHLPFGFGVEFDVLYRHLNYSGTVSVAGTTAFTSASAGNWEFPLLAKYRFPFKVVRPYVDAGAAWNKISGVSQAVATTAGLTPSVLSNSSVRGFVTGAGVDIHLLVLHLSPEIRYTRWGAKNFLSPNGGLSSNQNQAEFLLGVTF